MSESGDSSRNSFSTGASSAASDTSDAQALNALQDRAADGDGENINDSMSSNRGVSEAIFATLVLLGKNRSQQDLRWVVLRIVLEFLQMFRVVFNTQFLWLVHTDLAAFKAIRWVLFRFLVLPKGYNTYIVVFYIIAATIFLSLALTAYVAVVLKKDDSTTGGWLARLVQFMQLLAMIMYSVAWVSILDFLVFMFACHWDEVSVISSVTHMVFEKSCVAMPHLAHMAFAVVVTLTFMATCLGLSVGDCDLNPLTRNMLATPAAITNLTTLALKMVMVVLSTAGGSNPTLQSVVMAVCSGYITYQMIMAASYYSDWVNNVWNGLWTGIVYTCILLNVVTYKYPDNPAMRECMTWAVLYGIFAAVLLGAAASAARLWWLRRPLKVLRAAKDHPEALRNMGKVYRFRSTIQVEILARVMRKWDEDGQPDEEACALGEFINKCGLARFPNSATLMIALANFQIEARKDGHAARTQLQLAVKANPSTIERFFIFKTHDLAKKLKDERGGLDLTGYIEFQRNYRACVRAHRLALNAQRVFWQALLHDTVAFKSLQTSFAVMSQAEKQAAQIYRRVLERYPSNGRLLKIYGRFLEWVRNEPSVAHRYYTEAMKQGMGESLLALIGGASGSEKDGALKALGAVDEKSDGIVVLNTAGTIMAVNRAAFEMFGYSKGELEAKNVLCLMPQPFSGRHTGYITRYVQSGEPHILNSQRSLVGLDKNHTIFPINLIAVKLSGTGQDSVFMGLVRRADNPDPSVVRLWVAPGSGTILCADERFADIFGLGTSEVAGRAFSSLGPDAEELDRLIERASGVPVEERAEASLSLETKLLHKFLPPVDVCVGVQYAGSASEVILILTIQASTLAGAMMVVDHKSRVVYATTQLGAMLGYSARQVASMDLASLIPPPYSQMHAGFMKELATKPPATSCRAGAVVHLLRSNGVKVPVTLHLSTHDDGERLQHVVRVTPSSDAAAMDRARLVLGVDGSGIITRVNPGPSRALFGCSPQDMVGRPVRAFVNVFGEWSRMHGEDASLLTALGLRALDGADEAWRVGVLAQGDGDSKVDSRTSASTLTAALQQRNRVRPALLQAQVVIKDPEDEACTHSGSGRVPAFAAAAAPDAAASAGDEEEASLQLVLWRADALAAVVELDKALTVVRADAAAGLLFGVSSKMMINKDFKRLAGLPQSATASDLMTAATGEVGPGKKGGLKAGAAPKVGVRKRLHTTHADGGPLALIMQAVSKTSRGGQHVVVRLQLAEPSTGSVEPLLALKDAASQPAGASHLLAAAADSRSDSEHEDGGGGRGGSVDPGEERGAVVGGKRGICSKGLGPKVQHRGPALDADDADGDGGSDSGSGGGRHSRPHRRADPRMRVAQWVRQSDAIKVGPSAGEEEHDYEYNVRRGRRGGQDGLRGGDDGGGDSASEGSDSLAVDPGLAGGNGISYGVASVGDASVSQASGSEPGDGAGSAVGDGQAEEELAADFRRAKRLKKLNRMMTSSAAQSSTLRFKQQTWLCFGVILVAHVVGYAILSTQIQKRFENMHHTTIMAHATDRFQLSAMHANMAYECSKPDFVNFEVCSRASMQSTYDRLLTNIHLLRAWHQELYLGYPELVSFDDPRLVEFWTHRGLPEQSWMNVTSEGRGTIITRNATIWEMGNTFISAGYDVHYLAPLLGAALENDTSFNYMHINGPESIFFGYSWSLDLQVDFSWISLSHLSTWLIVLLVVEALCLQAACLAYQFFLVHTANSQHMRRFSVFLALPSGTIRIMASRKIAVDDDDDDEGDDDDDLEALAAQGQSRPGERLAADSADPGNKTASKSVRLAAGDDEDDDEKGGTPMKGKRKPGGKKHSASTAAAAAAAETEKNKKKPKSLGQRIHQALFGWMDTVIKLNGKKLVPNNSVISKFMLPLTVWAVAVIVVFGVTFQRLAGLQAPLASLNAAARVTYLISRVRVTGDHLAFASDINERHRIKDDLLLMVTDLREEYALLMYGGKIHHIAEGTTYSLLTPPAAFASPDVAQLFFRTNGCLRNDKSTCFKPDSPYHQITHNGLDAMVDRFIDTYEAFGNLPAELAYANHTLYLWLNQVVPDDMMDGIYQAIDLFGTYTISKFEGVTQLHQIMMVVTISVVLSFIVLLYRPYVKLLHEESKDIAGMLSQLPAEVSVEETVKVHVLGLPPRVDGRTASMVGGQSIMMMGPGGMMMAGPPGVSGQAGMGMMMSGMMGPGMRIPVPPGQPGMYAGGGGDGFGRGMYGGADGAVAVNVRGRGGAPGYY